MPTVVSSNSCAVPKLPDTVASTAGSARWRWRAYTGSAARELTLWLEREGKKQQKGLGSHDPLTGQAPML